MQKIFNRFNLIATGIFVVLVVGNYFVYSYIFKPEPPVENDEITIENQEGEEILENAPIKENTPNQNEIAKPVVENLQIVNSTDQANKSPEKQIIFVQESDKYGIQYGEQYIYEDKDIHIISNSKYIKPDSKKYLLPIFVEDMYDFTFGLDKSQDRLLILINELDSNHGLDTNLYGINYKTDSVKNYASFKKYKDDKRSGDAPLGPARIDKLFGDSKYLLIRFAECYACDPETEEIIVMNVDTENILDLGKFGTAIGAPFSSEGIIIDLNAGTFSYVKMEYKGQEINCPPPIYDSCPIYEPGKPVTVKLP